MARKVIENPSDEQRETGRKIREAREAKKLSQIDVAKEAGTFGSNIGAIERAELGASPKMVERIMSAIDRLEVKEPVVGRPKLGLGINIRSVFQNEAHPDFVREQLTANQRGDILLEAAEHRKRCGDDVAALFFTASELEEISGAMSFDEMRELLLSEAKERQDTAA